MNTIIKNLNIKTMLKFKILIVVLFAAFANIDFSYAQWSTISPTNNIWNLNTGNVGINKIDPLKKFEIWDGVTGRFTFSAASCTSGYEVGQTIDNVGYKLNVSSSIKDYRIAINGTDRLMISNIGNVGIGTTSPYDKLSVENGGLTLSSNTNIYSHYYAIKPSSDNTYLGIGYRDIFNNWYPNTAIPAIALTYTGKVGIGTINPVNNFEVVNSNSNTLDNAGFYNSYTYGNSNKAESRINLGKIENTTRQPMGAIGAFPSSNYDSNNGNLAFYTRQANNLVERVRINKDGKVGIGLTKPEEFMATTSATELLTVNGTIHAREVKVDLNTDLADFVFKPTYKLMPLNQVEQYVNTNSHLPEMPSASEVTKNGLNIGEMQNKLLQKVEELTLYMIEQQKTISQQSAKIEELEKKF